MLLELESKPADEQRLEIAYHFNFLLEPSAKRFPPNKRGVLQRLFRHFVVSYSTRRHVLLFQKLIAKIAILDFKTRGQQYVYARLVILVSNLKKVLGNKAVWRTSEDCENICKIIVQDKTIKNEMKIISSIQSDKPSPPPEKTGDKITNASFEKEVIRVKSAAPPGQGEDGRVRGNH